jgi:streptomycin 6-kinase
VAQRWALTPDGPPGHGFLSVVWPVRDPADRALVLKIHDGTTATDGERLALAAVRGAGMVELVASEATLNALLLQRLDPARTLLELPADEACGVIGDLVAVIAAHPAPDGLRSVAEVTDRIGDSITAMLDRVPEVLPRALVEQALETLEVVGAQTRASDGRLAVVHGDLHYENVLHTLPEDPAGWVAIDPLPAAGGPEWELAPAIRNRWDDAAATGDPERALRRRFDIVCERASLDRDLARAVLQAVAVDNVLWLTRATGVGPLVQSFLHPYSIVARW